MLDVVIDAIERGEIPCVVWPIVEPPEPEPWTGCPPGRKGKGRRHGYIATYRAGCRCDLCRAARRNDARRYRARRSSESTVEP